MNDVDTFPSVLYRVEGPHLVATGPQRTAPRYLHLPRPLFRLARDGQRQVAEGLVGLFDAQLVGRGQGLQEKTLTKSITQRSGEILRVKDCFSYRAEQAERVVVELWVTHTGQQPWTLERAELMNTEGTRLHLLRVWPSQPISPGGRRQLVVEAEATKEQSRGTFLLELREASGAGTVTVRGVTFP
jgi:uncharacterized protein (TIGR02268 family)